MYGRHQQDKGDGGKTGFSFVPQGLLRLLGLLEPTLGHTAVRVAMLLSFRALLRKGHVTLSDNSLCRKDVTFHPWGLMVNVVKSKTTQFKDKIHRIPIAKRGNREMCAVYWVQRHLEECPALKEALAFRLPRAGSSVPLTYRFYLSVRKELCVRTGLDPTRYSTPNLQRGGATFLRLCDAPIEVIKEKGGLEVPRCVLLSPGLCGRETDH